MRGSPLFMLSIALGAVVGLILALTGAGGGVLAVPLLMFGLGLGVAQAAPVALFAVGISAAMGAAIGLRTGQVRYRAAGWMALAGFAGAPLGWWLGRHIPNTPLTILFALVLAYTSLRMYARATQAGAGLAPAQAQVSAPCRRNPIDGRLHWTRSCFQALGSAGFAAGTLSSLLGVGGGFVIVPVLMRMTDLDMQSIAVTSLAVIALVSAGSIGVGWAAGQSVSWALALPFATGAVLGLLAGRRVAAHLSGPGLQQSFAVLGWMVAGLLVVRTGLGI
jgi:hypothetical protein